MITLKTLVSLAASFVASPMTKSKKTVTTPELASRGRQLVIIGVSISIMILATGSLWVAGAGIAQKIRLAHMVHQIDAILYVARQATEVNRHALDNGREDLLDTLSRLGQIQPTGEQDGIKTLTNPWDGTVRAYTVADDKIRIETTLPTAACQRIAQMFNQPDDMPDVQNLDIEISPHIWVPIYHANQPAAYDDTTIAGYCHTAPTMNLGMVIRL